MDEKSFKLPLGFLGPLSLVATLGLGIAKGFSLSPFFFFILVAGFATSYLFALSGCILGASLLILYGLIFQSDFSMWSLIFYASLSVGFFVTAEGAMDEEGDKEEIEEEEPLALEGEVERYRALAEAADREKESYLHENEALRLASIAARRELETLKNSQGSGHDKQDVEELNSLRVTQAQLKQLLDEKEAKIEDLQRQVDVQKESEYFEITETQDEASESQPLPQ